MNCSKCGAPLKENAKFCTICGSNVLSEDVQNSHLDTDATSEPQVENTNDQQQTFQEPYEINQKNYSQRSLKRNMLNSNTAFKVIAGILVILLLWKTAEHISLKRQIDKYESQDAVERTIDAADSWLEDILDLKDILPWNWVKGKK